MIDINSLNLLSILPSSITADPQVQAIAKATDPEFQSVSHDIREALIISRIDELPESVIDLLAWQWHVDFYEPGLSIDKKRALVRDSIPRHRKKGTRWAVENVVKAVFDDGKVIEWFEPDALSHSDGRPYTFGVETTAGVNDTNVLKMLIDAIFEEKNARSWLEYIVMISEYRSILYAGVGTIISEQIDISNIDDNDAAAPQLIGTRMFVLEEITVDMPKPAEGFSGVKVGDAIIHAGQSVSDSFTNVSANGAPLFDTTDTAPIVGIRVDDSTLRSDSSA